MVDLDCCVRLFTREDLAKFGKIEDLLNSRSITLVNEKHKEHFTTVGEMHTVINMTDAEFIADVVIPDDVKIKQVTRRTWQAERIILKNLKPLVQHPCWSDDDYCWYVVTRCGYICMMKKYITNPSVRLRAYVIQEATACIGYLQDLSDAEQLQAVRKFLPCFSLIKNPSFAACAEAISGNTPQHIYNFRCIDRRRIDYEQLCEIALNYNFYAVYDFQRISQILYGDIVIKFWELCQQQEEDSDEQVKLCRALEYVRLNAKFKRQEETPDDTCVLYLGNTNAEFVVVS